MGPQVNDIVRIFRQPPNVPAYVEGKVGYVTKVRDEDAYVQILRCTETDSGTGAGWMPFNCLQGEHGPEWRLAKEKVDADQGLLQMKLKRRAEEWNATIKDVARKHRLPTGTVRSVYEDLAEWVQRNPE
jgi:hypothetical protein